MHCSSLLIWFAHSRSPGRGEVLRISSYGDYHRIFLGLKVLIPGFFRVRNLASVFSFGWLDLKQTEIRGSARRSRGQSSANKVQPNLLRLGNSACMHGISWGVNVWSRNGLDCSQSPIFPYDRRDRALCVRVPSVDECQNYLGAGAVWEEARHV